MNTIKNALEKCRTYVAVQKFGCGHTGIGHGVEDNLLQLLNEAFEELAWLEKREPTLMSDCISAGLPLDVALKYDVQLCRLTNYVRDKALADYVKQKTATVDRDAFLAGYEEAQADANSCCVPPQGWLCTRQSGHDGPCAVIADDKERELVSRGMSRLSEPVKQEPVAVVKRQVGNSLVVHITGNVSAGDLLYTRPVRTKDLTDDEIAKWFGAATEGSLISFARAVIEKFKEKNRG